MGEKQAKKGKICQKSKCDKECAKADLKCAKKQDKKELKKQRDKVCEQKMKKEPEVKCELKVPQKVEKQRDADKKLNIKKTISKGDKNKKNKDETDSSSSSSSSSGSSSSSIPSSSSSSTGSSASSSPSPTSSSSSGSSTSSSSSSDDEATGGDKIAPNKQKELTSKPMEKKDSAKSKGKQKKGSKCNDESNDEKMKPTKRNDNAGAITSDNLPVIHGKVSVPDTDSDSSSDTDSDTDLEAKPAAVGTKGGKAVGKVAGSAQLLGDASSSSDDSSSDDSSDTDDSSDSSESDSKAATRAKGKGTGKTIGGKEATKKDGKDKQSKTKEIKQKGAQKKMAAEGIKNSKSKKPVKQSESSDNESDDSSEIEAPAKNAKHGNKENENNENEECNGVTDAPKLDNKRHRTNEDDSPKKRIQMDKMEIFCAGLPYSISEDELKKLFEDDCGEVTSLKILANKGVAFIGFATAEAAAKACGYNGTQYQGRSLRINLSGDKPQGFQKGFGGDRNAGAGRGPGAFADRGPIPPSNQIVVRNISFGTSEETMRELFGECGKIAGCRIPTYPDSGKSMGRCFIDFDSVESATRALQWSNTEIDGRKVTIEYAMPRGSSPRDDGQRGGGFNKGAGGPGRRPGARVGGHADATFSGKKTTFDDSD